MCKILERLNAARRAGVPIVAINTPDQPAMAALIAAKVETPGSKAETPVLGFDFVRGLHAKNKAAIAVMGQGGLEEGTGRMCPFTMLAESRDKLPHGAVLLYMNAQRFVGDATVMQSLMNVRDQFKGDGRTVILIGHAITLPPELATDVIQLSEDLPDDERLVEIVTEQVVAAGDQFRKRPDKDAVRKAAIALRGTSAFGAEQLTVMSFRDTGIDHETLHTQAKALVEQTIGLHFERGKETFADIGGLEFFKEFGSRLFSGPHAPAAIIRIEELEKAMAGSKGDLSGTSGDALQVLLTSMEDYDFSGMLAYGVPGAGKSLAAKATANTHGAKALVLDINACKGSLVGSSEKNIRHAMEVIRAVAGNRAFFIASCNALDSIPAALQRRFRVGTWFFDLPGERERLEIWALQCKRYGIECADLPDEDSLSGADIRNIVETAHTLNCSLKEARRYVVPLKVQARASIDDARKMATGRFTCAASGGVYGVTAEADQKVGRKVRVS